MVLRVFKLSFIFFILSCNTIPDSHMSEVRTIGIKDKELKTIIKTPENLKSDVVSIIDYITDGSISTMNILGNDLWIGKLGGSLIRYNLYTKDIKVFTDDIYSIKDFSIKNIIETKNNIIALQSDRVVIINKSNEQISYKIFPDEISRATDMVISNNRVFISTLGFGVREFRVNTGVFKELIPNLNYVSSLYIDDKTLYIGTMDNGLYEYDLNMKRLLSRISYPLALFNKNIIKIDKKNDILWLGCAAQGLIKWNLQNNTTKRLYENESVSSIYLGDANVNAVSFIGSGVYIEKGNQFIFESIDVDLITNNITSVSIFNNCLITGNIKRGLIKQEILFLND